MIIILGTIRLESAAETQRIEAALVARAKRSRTDAGNIDYTFSRSIDDASEIRLTEVWENAETLDAHLKIPDAEFSALMTTAKIVSATVTAYDGSNARVLMSR